MLNSLVTSTEQRLGFARGGLLVWETTRHVAVAWAGCSPKTREPGHEFLIVNKLWWPEKDWEDLDGFVLDVAAWRKDHHTSNVSETRRHALVAGISQWRHGHIPGGYRVVKLTTVSSIKYRMLQYGCVLMSTYLVLSSLSLRDGIGPMNGYKPKVDASRISLSIDHGLCQNYRPWSSSKYTYILEKNGRLDPESHHGTFWLKPCIMKCPKSAITF